MQPGCSFAEIIESVIRNIDIQFATVNVLNSKKRDETNELKGRGVSYLKDEDEKIEICFDAKHCDLRRFILLLFLWLLFFLPFLFLFLFLSLFLFLFFLFPNMLLDPFEDGQSLLGIRDSHGG